MKKLIVKGIRILSASLLIASLFLTFNFTVKADELDYGTYDIVFNPTGTHFYDNQLKIRLDFYPKEGTKAYEHQYVYMPIEPIPPYPGEVDKDGQPLNWDDYNIWWDSLPHEWRLNPALCLFVKVDSTTTIADLQNYIETTFTPEMIATIDDVIVLENSAHLISPLLRDKNIIDEMYSIGDKETIITDTNIKFADFYVLGNSTAEPLVIQPQSIDIGGDAINRDSSSVIDDYTYIDLNNSANATGTLDTHEVYLNDDAVGYYTGTFYLVSGTTFKCRDSEALGDVSAGSKQTFPGLSYSVQTGDYIGFYATPPELAKIEKDDSGSGYYSVSGMHINPDDEAEYTLYSPRITSAYSTGTETGGGSSPTVATSAASDIDETTATLTGNITDVGSENADYRGFQWGASTGVYSTNVTESGNFSTGTYSLGATGLPPGDEIYWRATAHNSEGWGYGSELYLETKPQAPTGLADNNRGSTWINIAWTKGMGSENTTVRYRTNAYPSSYSDGTLAYNGTAETANVTGLSPGQIHYFGGWAVSTDNTTIYSDDSVQLAAYTLPGDPANIDLSNATCSTIDAEWTKGPGGDYSMVRWKTGDYPSNETDGTQGYFGTSNTTTITGLPDSTQIYVRIWSYDSDSTYYSDSYTGDNLVTLASSDPTFTTSAASSVTTTTATLNGIIADLDCAQADNTYWQLGSATGVYDVANYTDTTNRNNGVVSYPLTGLTANTTYYFRGGADISGGSTQWGSELSFTTEEESESSTSELTGFDAFLVLSPLLILVAFIVSGGALLYIGVKEFRGRGFNVDGLVICLFGFVLVAIGFFALNVITDVINSIVGS